MSIKNTEATSLLKEGVLLSEYSTFGIGGPALYFAEIKTAEEASSLFSSLKDTPFIVIGKGSNTLFDDRGYNGCVLLNKIDFFEQQENVFTVGSGFNFSHLGAKTSRLLFHGLEFASGIPGTVGGAIYMNAGANGQETADALVSVTFLDMDGKLHTLTKEQIEFGYRFSSFHNMKGMIISASFALKQDPNAKEHQLEIVRYRMKTQPYGEMSAGCVFQNPKNTEGAGFLIEKSGCKGMRIGGAEVSLMHGNFIINRGGATASDVLGLMKRVQDKVFDETGICLDVELKKVPYVEA